MLEYLTKTARELLEKYMPYKLLNPQSYSLYIKRVTFWVIEKVYRQYFLNFCTLTFSNHTCFTRLTLENRERERERLLCEVEAKLLCLIDI